jgi:hypothetical protein
MRAKWLKFSILPSIKVRVGGQCIAPKTRTTLILDRSPDEPKAMSGERTEDYILHSTPRLTATS